jgi:hypothetical protein
MPAWVPTTAVLLFVASPFLGAPAWSQAAPAPQTVAKATAPATPASATSPAQPVVADSGAAAPATAPASTDTALPKPVEPPAGGGPPKSNTLFFYTSPRSTVEMEVHSIPPTNKERLERLRNGFAAVDCGSDRMREQRVEGKHGDTGTNLICVWPGSGSGTIVIAAHYEHEGQGDGALADWSGAILLPFLYQAVQGQPRENTYVFLEAYKREGADIWVKSLSRADRKRIRAMIDLDGLGLSYTRFFTTFSPFETTTPASAHLQAQLLWSALSDGLTQAPEQASPHHWLSVDATDPFRAFMVPTIVIHSVPPESAKIPGSAADVASAVNGNAYFQTYHLMCAYLTSLDHVAAKLDTQDPLWETGPGNVNPESDNLRVTFRNFSNGRLAGPTP